jgi:hypothetical protein
MNQLLVAHPRWLAYVGRYVAVPVFALLALLTVLAIVGKYRIVETPVAALPVGSIIFDSVPIALFSYFGVAFFRLRHAFFSSYVFSPRGLSIHSHSLGTLDLGWQEVERAQYRRFMKVLTLHSSKLPAPVSITNNSMFRVSSEFSAAILLAKRELGAAWRESLL